MKYIRVACSIALLARACHAMALECYEDDTVYYRQETPYTDKLQKMIDSASASQLPVVYLEPGLFVIDTDKPIVLKKGVSLKGHPSQPTIFATKDRESTATIEVEQTNQAWTIQDIVFENVNIRTVDNSYDDESAIFGNIFMNGDNSSIMSDNGKRLYIDSNIFLRDSAHASMKSDSTTPSVSNMGIVLHAQKNSLVSNNIFGMDLRKIDSFDDVVDVKLEKPLKNLKFIYQCLNRSLDDQQGYLSSGIQVTEASDITINENIMNMTLSDTLLQDHAVLITKSNQAFVYQNFFAGGRMNQLDGTVQFASSIDGYFVSNYMANMGLVLSALNETSGSELNNMIVYNNFFYRFMDQGGPKGLRYDGISYFDFHSSIKTQSSYGWHMVISNNRFGATPGVDPSFISMGNLEAKEGLVDRRNCYVTEPLVPGSTDASVVPILYRQSFEEGIFTKNQGRIPKKLFQYTKNDLYDQIPSHLRYLPVLHHWKAFTLKNDAVTMLDPTTPCKIT